MHQSKFNIFHFHDVTQIRWSKRLREERPIKVERREHEMKEFQAINTWRKFTIDCYKIVIMQIGTIEMISFVFRFWKGVGFLCKSLIAAAHFEGSNVRCEKQNKRKIHAVYLYFKYKSPKRQTADSQMRCFLFSI